MNKIMKFGLIAAFTLTSSPLLSKKSIPLVYDVEHTGAHFDAPYLPTLEEAPVIKTLPNPFEWSNGKGEVKKFKDWSRRRSEIIKELQHYELGDKPMVQRENITASINDKILTVNVTVNGETLTITASIKYPQGDGPFPAIIGMGGGSGSLPSAMFDQRGIAQISYNFGQVMAHTQKRGTEPINKLYPELIEMGSYSAWPWGLSRILDGLEIVGVEIRDRKSVV